MFTADIPLTQLVYDYSLRCCHCQGEIYSDETEYARCLGTCGQVLHTHCSRPENVTIFPSDNNSSGWWICPACREARRDPAYFLPPEVCEHIFSYLTVKELATCSLVCHRWRTLAGSDPVWKIKSNENCITGFSYDNTYKSFSLLPPTGKRICHYRNKINFIFREGEKLYCTNKNAVTLQYVDRVDSDGRSLVVQRRSEYTKKTWELDIYNLAEGTLASKEQTIIVNHPSPSIKMTTNLIVVIEGSSVKFYKKNLDFQLTFSFLYDTNIGKYKPNPPQNDSPDNWCVDHLLLNPYFMYVKFLESNEIHVWSLVNYKLLKRIQIPLDGLVLPSLRTSYSLCFHEESNKSRIMVINGMNDFVLSFESPLQEFRSNRRLIGCLLENGRVCTYDYFGRLIHIFPALSGWDHSFFNVHKDCSIIYTTHENIVVTTPTGPILDIKKHNKVFDSYSFLGTYCILLVTLRGLRIIIPYHTNVISHGLFVTLEHIFYKVKSSSFYYKVSILNHNN